MTDLMRIVLILSVGGTALALALAALRRLLRNRLPKAVFYYLWLLVLLRLVVPAALPVSLPQLSQSTPPAEDPAVIQPAASQTAVPAVDATQPVPEDLTFSYTPNTVITGSGLPLQTQTPSGPAWYETAWQWLCAHFAPVWLTGVAVHFLWFLLSYLHYRRQLLWDSVPLLEHEQALLDELRAGRRVTALRSPLAQTPLLVGLLRPRIFLPETPVSTRELECILRHELTHLSRRDLLYKWFAVAATSFHWFNPLMPWLRRELSRSCELACDEAVIRAMDEAHRRQYGETLLTMAAARALPRGVPATMLCEEKRQLKERLQGILRHKRLTAAIVLLSLLLVLGMAGCAAVLGPQRNEEAEAPSVTGPLTEEQQATVLEAIEAWAADNVTYEGARQLTYGAPNGHPEALGFLADIGDAWLYDLSDSTVRAIDGTYPDTADLGYVCLTVSQGDDVQSLVTFYLTCGSRGQDGDPIAALTQLAKQYPAAKTGYLDWAEQNGRPAYVVCYFRQDGQEYSFQYSDVCGFWDAQPREADSGRSTAVALTDLPRTMAAITDWQRTHAESPDDRSFHMTLNAPVDQATLNHVWQSRLFCDPSTGEIREGAPNETSQNLCASVSLLYCEDPDARVWLLESSVPTFPTEPTTTLYNVVKTLMEQEFHRVYDPYYDILSLTLSDWQEADGEATFTCIMTWQQYERDVTQVAWLKQYEGTDSYGTMCREYLAQQTGSFLLRVTEQDGALTLYANESAAGDPIWAECRVDDFILKSDSQRMYAAYGRLLWDVYDRGLLPDGTELARSGEPEYSSFALADVDGDGSTELILRWQEGAVADLLLAVYGWRDGYLYEQGRFFPQVHFYSNGALAADWSHNQGPSAEDFWPYDAYSYDETTDTWQRVGSADSDGQRYYLLPADWEGAYSEDLLVDETDYLTWRKDWLQGGEELELAEQALTADAIAQLGASRPARTTEEPAG